MTKKLTILTDKGEPLTLLFFKENNLFIGFIIQNGTEILKTFTSKSFEESVADIKAFLDDMGDYGLVEQVELDDQIKSLLERLSTN